MNQNILCLPGDSSGTPPLDPIPNSTVKRSSADGTTLWESRSSPGILRMFKSPSNSKTPSYEMGFFYDSHRSGSYPVNCRIFVPGGPTGGIINDFGACWFL